MFIKERRIAESIESDPSNIIYARERMDFGTKQRVYADFSAIKQNYGGMTDGVLFLYNIALLKHNILDWEGPAFRDEAGRPIPCTPESIEQLDPDEPLVTKVLQGIQARNPLIKASPDPKYRGADGSTNNGTLHSNMAGSTTP